jgi:hypothetical protein
MGLRPRSQRVGNQLTVRRAGTHLGDRPRREGGPGVGGTVPVMAHFDGPGWVDSPGAMAGFCRPLVRLTTRPPTAIRRAQITGDRLATDGGHRFDAPLGPDQSSQRRYLRFLVVAEDVAHPQRWTMSLTLASFQVSINGRVLLVHRGKCLRLILRRIVADAVRGDSRIDRRCAVQFAGEALSTRNERGASSFPTPDGGVRGCGTL